MKRRSKLVEKEDMSGKIDLEYGRKRNASIG